MTAQVPLYCDHGLDTSTPCPACTATWAGKIEATARRQVRRFRVDRRFDGAPGMVVEIILTGPEPLFRVRLKHRRATIEVPLGDVAEMILIRDARVRAAEATRERAAKRAARGLRARPRR